MKVIAPTGTAAFNVNGETIHRMMNMAVSKAHYKPNTLKGEAKLKLVKKFKHLLAVIIDERSLVAASDFGTLETQLSETIYGGGPLAEESFGGLPILVMVGDDYQLPSTNESSLDALYKTGGSAMSRRGRMAFLECAKHVMELTSSKRLGEDQLADRELMMRLRDPETMTNDQVEKLLSLHLKRIEIEHGADTVAEIKKDAIYLFWTNAKRIRHNMEQLLKLSSATNPVAVLPCQSIGSLCDRGSASHFDSKLPASAFLCRGAKCALDNKNFHPSWGLHNGACGTVEEIVFAKGHSPNNGNHPLYVVVHFPLYSGPPWDKNRPKVRRAQFGNPRAPPIPKTNTRLRATVRPHPSGRLWLQEEIHLLPPEVYSPLSFLRQDNP